MPLPVGAEPIVFDFEDGLQGWELNGATTRVQTQVLGGEWAIFLDGLVEGGASIFITGDLQTVGSVTFDQLIVDGSGSVIPVLRGAALVNNVFTDFIEIGFPVVQGGMPPEPLVAFIDNITFHPVPEPSTLALLALGLAVLAIGGRLTALRYSSSSLPRHRTCRSPDLGHRNCSLPGTPGIRRACRGKTAVRVR